VTLQRTAAGEYVERLGGIGVLVGAQLEALTAK